MLRKQALSCIKMLEGRKTDLGTRENKTEKFYPMPWFHRVKSRNWNQQTFLLKGSPSGARQPINDLILANISKRLPTTKPRRANQACWRGQQPRQPKGRSSAQKRSNREGETRWATSSPTFSEAVKSATCRLSDNTNLGSSNTPKKKKKKWGKWHWWHSPWEKWVIVSKSACSTAPRNFSMTPPPPKQWASNK